MAAIASIEDLKAAKKALESHKKKFPEAHKAFVELLKSHRMVGYKNIARLAYGSTPEELKSQLSVAALYYWRNRKKRLKAVKDRTDGFTEEQKQERRDYMRDYMRRRKKNKKQIIRYCQLEKTPQNLELAIES